MGKGKLGRYCEQAKRWLIPEVWSKWWRKKKKINKGEGAIKSVKPGKNLARKRKEQDSIIKTREKTMGEYGIKDPKIRTNLRTKANQPKINKKMSDIIDR